MTIDFSLRAILFFIAGISTGYLIMAISATIYFCNRKCKINQYLAVYGFLGSIWTILGSFNLLIPLWPARIILLQMIPSYFLGTFFFLFAKAISNENYKFNKHDAMWFIPPLFMTINNIAILLTPELFSTVNQAIIIENSMLYLRPDATFYFHSIVLLLGHVAGGIIIFKQNRKESNLQHKKRNTVMMISILMGIGGCFVIGNLFPLLNHPTPVVLYFPLIAISMIIASYSLLATQSWKLEYFIEIIRNDEKLLKKQFNEIKRLSYMDPLTEIYNRNMLYEELDNFISRAHRYNEPVSIIIFDIDHFKQVNDIHGHLTGDEVLVELADLVQSLLRKNDLLARWGGEEFIILVPHATLHGAIELAGKIQNHISEHSFKKIKRLRCSFGVCQYNTLYTQKEFLTWADKALYKAKQWGRNRICVYSKKSGFITIEGEESYSWLRNIRLQDEHENEDLTGHQSTTPNQKLTATK